MSNDLKNIFGEIESTFTSLFKFMEVAEDVIEERKAKDPKNKDKIHNLFLAMQPTDILKKRDIKVYREYCHNIIDNALKDLPENYPTDIDVMLSLHEMSLLAPLKREYTAAYMKIFRRMYPDVDLGEEIRLTDYEKTEVDEIILEIKETIWKKRK